MLSGDNGILKRATDAKTKNDEAQIRERIQLAYHSALTKDITGESGELTMPTLQGELNNEFTGKTVTITPSDKEWTIKVDDVEETVPAGKTIVVSKLTDEEKTALEENAIEEITSSVTNKDLTDSSKIKAVLTGNVPIPVGANYLLGTVDTGVVIAYKGSEFVWIPINLDLTAKGTSKLMAKVSTGSFAGTDENGRTNYEGVLYDNNLNVRTEYGQSTTSYREPATLNYYDVDSQPYLNAIGLTATDFEKELKENYNAMIESVQKYGGFYVGRYESSLNGNSAKSISGVKPMSALSTEGDTWYGLYQKQKNFTTSSDSMVASMIWGSQYDAMLNWAKNSGTTTGSHVTQTGYGNHNNTRVLECGSYNNGSDIINNIYDLEGNLLEWTLEAESHWDCYRETRGGDYKNTSSFTPAGHNGVCPFKADDNLGSRLSLYVK